MDILTYMTIALGCSAVLDDPRRGLISNWVNLTAIAGGLLYHSIHRGWHGLAASAGGAVLGFSLFLAVYCLGGLGGGDVKLMAAFGALLGPMGILTAAVLTCVIGGLMAAVSLALRRRRKAIPYGPAIVLGAWLALLAGR
jgi:prepilin peptidase CpaA